MYEISRQWGKIKAAYINSLPNIKDGRKAIKPIFIKILKPKLLFYKIG